MASLNFDATAIDTSSRDAITPGTYEALIVESELRPCRSGLGKGINLTFEIVSGPAKGRKVWDWINFIHPKQDVQRIGQEQLARICNAVGVAKLDDTEQLHNIPLMITVALDKDDQTRNVIRKYAAKPRVGQPSAATETAAPASATGSAPWAR